MTQGRRYPEGLVCPVEGCTSPAKLLGFCRFHYMRFRSNTRLDKPFGTRDGEFSNCYPKAAGTGSRKRLHVAIAEKALGKPLPLGAEVHHVDEVKSHNWNSNLVICQSHAYHSLLHLRARILKAGGDPNTQRICSHCKQLLDISDITASNQCRACKNKMARDRQHG